MNPVSAPQPVDVILRDGTTLRLRPSERSDAEAVLEFFSSLSERSVYLRFHGIPRLDERLIAPMLEPDWQQRGALIAALAANGRERVVAIASYVRLRDPALAEVAFAVADDLQGRGLGTRLLEQLAERAGHAGVERFVADVMFENAPMLAVFRDAGFDVSRRLDRGTVEVEFPIAATEAYREQIDARDHAAVRASLRSFFEPSSVAVIGASQRRGTIGGELFRNVLAADFTGAAYPVNRDGDSVAGVRGYRSIADIEDEIDVAVVAVPAGSVLGAAGEALQKGVKALVVISAGFAEVGREGETRQQQLLELVRGHGARLIGPNCLGIAVAGPRLNATFAARAAPSGNIGFSSQSGALGLALLEAAEARGLGLSAFVSIGNKADVSSNDLLEYWEDDPATEVILLYVESFGNPRRFGRLARRVARSKPILALKSGTTASGARAASSHTAALAGSEAAVDALFRQAGVIRAGSLEELVDVATLLSTQPELRGRRVAVLTNAGGLGILCADACESAGLELPPLGREATETLRRSLPAEASLANPVDMLGSATAATYEAALPTILADPAIDAAIVLFVPAVTATAEEVAEALERALRAEMPDKPVLAVVMSASGIPAALRSPSRRAAAFAYPESAARALGRAADRAAWLRRPLGTTVQLERASGAEIVERALERGDDVWLTADEVRGLLSAYRIPLVEERVSADVESALAAARELGFPVVVKTAAAGVHKTEVGGVALDLRDEEAVRQVVDRIGPPVLVQQMVKGGVELLAGLVQDPVFGPLVAFGPGGTFAELIGDAGFAIAPLTDVDAQELVSEGKAGRLVAGFRGAPPADAGALTELVLRLSQLGEDLPAVAELDLNPVVGRPDGCVVLDARVRVARPQVAARVKTW